MKNKINSFKAYYKLHPKRFWVLGVILVVVLIIVFTHKTPSTDTIVTVTRTDLKQTILATGQVTSETDLGLSFPTAGIIARLPVAVGDKVYRGQVLAALDNRNEYAALKSAQANYEKVIEGASSEEVAVAQAALASAQTSLDNIEKVQDTLVANAHRALLNTDLTPVLTAGSSGTAPSITGTYAGGQDGSYTIVPHATSNAGYFTYEGLETGTGTISTMGPIPLGTKGLFIQFAADYVYNQSSVWTVLLPNTKSVHYLADYNAYQNAQKNRDSTIAGAQAAVAEAQANLDLKRAAARPADMAVAQAQIDEAEATYQKTIIVAPASGTITHVDIKIGERADAQKEVLVLENVNELYVEAKINETNIAKVALGQPVTMTLDAFGPDVAFTGTVVHIDPSATTEDGVVNYVIKASIDNGSSQKIDDNRSALQAAIRPGMNANMMITAWDHPNVLVIPKAAVKAVSGSLVVNVITDAKKKKTEQRVITTGDLGDGNLIEVTSGLAEGDKILITQ